MTNAVNVLFAHVLREWNKGELICWQRLGVQDGANCGEFYTNVMYMHNFLVTGD